MPSENDPKSGMGRGWQSTLRAKTKEEAENRLRTLGYSWEWLPGDELRATTPVLPAVRRLDGGRKSFFNQLIAAYQGWKDTRNDPSKAITFGDGTPLDREAVNIAAELAEGWPSMCRGRKGTWRWSIISSRCTAGGHFPERARCWPRSSPAKRSSLGRSGGLGIFIELCQLNEQRLKASQVFVLDQRGLRLLQRR